MHAEGDADSTAEITGHVAWPAAAALARRVATDWSARPATSALELGCGCGIGGLAAAALGASRVEFSDRDAGVLRLARRGFEASDYANCRATFEASSWGPPAADAEKFDLVFGSDLIYDSGVVAPLVATAAGRLAADGVFMLAQSFPLGDASTAALRDACAAARLELRLVFELGEMRIWRIAGRQ